ncbi:hypothetical protein M717_04720 [Neisseria gonorrhoeae SK33414]|nr:hypothetical protein M717_04720 [Neisseria gonorrhoeae SK33414]KLR82687.1 hypothetical protein M684_00435 [Neisseria gonorrhoeae SK15454]KLR82987.1 hypothetical protein M675_05020 [Neisseria gonorrhoeae SK1902]KLS05244.1 hypothetical protein M725_04730 [Neisseria gonorrhoeae ATL_2011_01_08]KLS36317.1 hypothetical protein M735_09740 [Neisseria gonorrhoeae MIA_2011_03-09]KLS38912.1 hypothetical protein M724_09645 [Neisseria gonorrhoeae ATL_2011_01_05]KLS42570.1 hypothetical protein M720_0865
MFRKPPQPISAAFAAIIANGKTTKSEKHNTVRPRLSLKPGSTPGVLSGNIKQC